MSISGGIKFFDRNFCLLEDGASVVASNGQSTANRALDRNVYSYYRTSGSSDAVSETFEVTFPETKSLDRILLIDHNFKDYDIEYDVAGVWTAFTNVVGIDGALGGGISESTYSRSVSYYEFDEVSTDKIQITIDGTQVADAEKYLQQIIASMELGTFSGFPNLRRNKHSRNIRKRTVLSGKTLVQKGLRSSDFRLQFQNYPASYSGDLDLVGTLDERETDFLMWPCGGRTGSDYFKYELRGFRLQDIYACNITSDIDNTYRNNTYVGPINFSINLEEAP